MKQVKEFFNWIISLIGLSFVIVIHELGHFLACKVFNVDTPVFSVGFGPALASIKLGMTTFQLALLPLGGYVSMDTAEFNAASYGAKMIIILAGIVINIVFGFAVLRLPGMKERYADIRNSITSESGFVGPIGIIRLIHDTLRLSWQHFLLILGLLSVNIGFFNLLPIPLLDGGQLLSITVRQFMTPATAPYFYLFLLVLFLVWYTLFVRRRRR